MVANSYRSLDVYMRSVRLADEVRAEIETWPALDKWSLGIQLIRAVDSIGANIAEGYGRRSNPDRRRFLYMARGSMCESEHWIHRARARGLLVGEGSIEHVETIGRMLNGLIKSHLQS